MQHIFSRSLFAVMLATMTADAQDLSTWLAQLPSGDCAVRQAGFYAIMQSEVRSIAQIGSVSDQVKVALINLLILEEAFHKNPVNQAVLDGACGEYFGDVVTTVAALRDPRSLDAMMGAIGTGGAVADALASLGAPALDKVLVVAGTSGHKADGLFVLGKMLDAGTVNDAVSLAKIRPVLNAASLETDYQGGLFALEDLLKLFHVPNVPVLVTHVQIAIKPGESPASINPRSNGVIPGVAILSSATFDATTIDDQTARFGPGQASPKGRAKVQDVNKDGLPDMVFQFSTPESMIACGDTASFLFAKTTSGQAVVGADAIRTVGCP